MFDLLIRRAAIPDDAGLSTKSLAISDGRIVALLDPLEVVEAVETIDADRLIAIPGFVDAHVHLREPGLLHKEGFVSGARAAAAGGVTTLMVMPTDDPMTTSPDLFIEKKELASGKCLVDYALQAALGPDTRHVRALAELGAISFEVFMADLAPPILVAKGNELLRCLKAAREVDALVGLTPGDDSVVQELSDFEQKAERPDRHGFTRSRPAVAEAMGVARACVAVADVGVRAHLRQISSAQSLATMQALRPPRLSAETTPHHLFLDHRELVRQGPIAKVVPPLRTGCDIEALRATLSDGGVDIVATDHAPHSPQEKKSGDENIWLAPSGFPGLQTFLPLMLRLVGEGVIDYADLIRLCCEKPARVFGLYPRKGVLAPGSDADIVLIDPNQAFEINNQDQESKARVTPFAGLIAPARPVMTLLRGQVIMRNGRPEGRPRGAFLRPG